MREHGSKYLNSIEKFKNANILPHLHFIPVLDINHCRVVSVFIPLMVSSIALITGNKSRHLLLLY